MEIFVSLISRFLLKYRGIWISIGLILAALPFVALAFYNHPTLDDFLDAVTVRKLGFWQSQKFFYTTLTGRYTTTVLLALINPLVYGQLESSWWVTLAFIMGTFILLRYSIFALCGIEGIKAWWGSGLLLGLWLAYAPGHAEGLYWFTGAYTYVITAWLLLLWLIALEYYAKARLSKTPKKVWLTILSVLTLAVAGTTEPLALPFLLVLLLGGCVCVWLKRGRIVYILAGIALVGCVISFTAPGNFVRMEFMGNHFGLLKTVSYSTFTTAYLLLTWVANPVLLVITALLMPTLYWAAQKRKGVITFYLSQIPLFFLILLFVVLLVVASCPAYYASGTGLPLRARNMLYLLFLLGWFSFILTWCFRQVNREAPSKLLTALLNPSLSSLWTVLLIAFFFADYNFQTRASKVGQGSNNVIRAYRQWLGGDAAAYDAERRARYNLIKTGGASVKILPLRNRPDLLFSFDIAEVQDTVMLRQYAEYFNKKRILTSGER